MDVFAQETEESILHLRLQGVEDIVSKIKADSCSLLNDKVELERLVTFIDLTTLNGNDMRSHIECIVERALSPIPSIPHLCCAAVCVYPARILDAVLHLKRLGKKLTLNIASVAGGFPSGQYLLITRQLEIHLAVKDGANEIDAVINRAAALEQNWEMVFDEVKQMKRASMSACLKIILATGELVSGENIYRASFASMLAGADFIKTSTGKELTNATLYAAVVMCKAILRYFQISGRKVGFKPAGGIQTVADALQYRYAVELILGSEWLTPTLFRIGASRLLDCLVEELEERSLNS